MNSLSSTGIDQPVGVALPAGLYAFLPGTEIAWSTA
jgi:hypothetical protein